MERREFLQNSLLSILGCHVLACAPLRFSTPDNGSAVLFIHQPHRTSKMRFLDLNTFTFSDINVPLHAPHTSQPVYGKQDEYIVFDFMGKALKVNRDTKEISEAPGIGSRFLGHGTQDGDGHIWCTELLESGEVLVRARSSENLALIDSSGSSFSGGHHVARMPGSSVLVSSGYNHERKMSSIVFFDRQTNRLTKSELPLNLIISHILPISATEVVCITNYTIESSARTSEKKSFYANSTDKMISTIPQKKSRGHEVDFDAPAPLIYGNMNGEMKIFWDEEKKDLFRFGFGIYHFAGSRDRFISGHSNSNKVIIWKDRTPEKIIDVPAPAGIIQTPDRERLVILSNGILKIYSLRKNQFERDIKYDGFITSMSAYA